MLTLLLGKPKLVQELLQTLPYSARPLKVNGIWRAPKLRKREVKALYEASCFHKIPFPEEHKVLLEKEEKEVVKHGFIKPQRLRADVKNYSARIEQINKALSQQTPKIEKYREEERDRRYKDFYDLGLFGRVSVDDPKSKYMVDKLMKGNAKKPNNKGNKKNAAKKKK
ncbi:hypothetical protein ABK040_009374 [Willaertia magna]